MCVCKKVLLEQQQKQYNEAKIGKVRKCSSSPQRAQVLIGLKVPFRMVCIWQACARVHSHTHTYTHTQSEPWHLYASAFHVLSSLRTLHISTSTLLFIWVARLLITTQPSGQSTGKPAYLWLRKNCTPLQIQIALLCFLVIKWHVYYRWSSWTVLGQLSGSLHRKGRKCDVHIKCSKKKKKELLAL